MNKLEFSITGTPVAQARPRVTRNGTFKPEKTRKHENHITSVARMELNVLGFPAPFTDRAVKLEVDFFMPVPKSWPKWRKKKAHEGQLVPETKPDLDNLVKLVKDALNGYAFRDDSQIVEIAAVQHYAPRHNNPWTDVVVKEVSYG